MYFLHISPHEIKSNYIPFLKCLRKIRRDLGALGDPARAARRDQFSRERLGVRHLNAVCFWVYFPQLSLPYRNSLPFSPGTSRGNLETSAPILEAGPIFRGSASSGRFLNVVDFWVTCSTMTSRRKNKKNSSKFLYGLDWSSMECMWGLGGLGKPTWRSRGPRGGERAARKEKVSGDKLWLWRPRSGLLKWFNLVPIGRSGASASTGQGGQLAGAYP